MARPSVKLIAAIRTAAEKLKNTEDYQWGHMGACNCGNLVQELTHLSKGTIHSYAMRGQGDWTEQAQAFCPTSEMPMDLLINQLIGAGLTLEDIMNLERLRDHQVLKRIPLDRRNQMKHNNRLDVALYLETWAEQLEDIFVSNEANKRVQEVVIS